MHTHFYLSCNYSHGVACSVPSISLWEHNVHALDNLCQVSFRKMRNYICAVAENMAIDKLKPPFTPTAKSLPVDNVDGTGPSTIANDERHQEQQLVDQTLEQVRRSASKVLLTKRAGLFTLRDQQLATICVTHLDGGCYFCRSSHLSEKITRRCNRVHAPHVN